MDNTLYFDWHSLHIRTEGQGCMESPEIYHYTSLEAYLGRYVQYRKSLNPSFSYAVWANKLGVKSAATLHMITNGQRSPGKSLVDKLQRHLALNTEESRYFEILVNLKKHKAKVVPSLQLMKELEDRHPYKGFKLIEHDEFKLISNWYCWAILEMVNLKDFKEDPRWIVEKLEYPVSVDEIKEAMLTMERAGLIGRNRNGKMSRTTKPLTTASDSGAEAIKNYHIQNLKNTIESVNKHTSHERNLESLTLAMPDSDMPEAKKMIRKFVDDFCRRFDNPKASKVFHMGVTLIPLTQDLRRKK